MYAGQDRVLALHMLDKALNMGYTENGGFVMTWEESNARVTDEYEWFDANRNAIIENHHGEYAVIQHHHVLGYFPNTDAVWNFIEAQGIQHGDYAAQLCLTEEEESECCYNPYNMEFIDNDDRQDTYS
jgi:hypothetical protein